MKSWTNLLPWRLTRHKTLSRNIIAILIIFIIIAVLLHIQLNQYNQQYLAEYQQQYAQYKSTKLQLNQTEQQLNQLQQNLQPFSQQSAVQISTDFVNRLFELLSELPLTQGELQQIQFSAEKLSLAGYALDHLEFEQIDQFLKDNPQIEQLKLSEFSAQSQGLLQFEFQLKLIE